jgi:hypothetical protein
VDPEDLMDKLVSQDHLEKMESQDQPVHPDKLANEENQDTQVLVVMKVTVEPQDHLEKMELMVSPVPVDPQDLQD